MHQPVTSQADACTSQAYACMCMHLAGLCMQLLHGFCCFDFVSDIPLPLATLPAQPALFVSLVLLVAAKKPSIPLQDVVLVAGI